MYSGHEQQSRLPDTTQVHLLAGSNEFRCASQSASTNEYGQGLGEVTGV
jgi:hypothetical protein